MKHSMMTSKPPTMLEVFGAGALALALLIGVRPASAAPPCMTHDEITKQLEVRHAELPISLGFAHSGRVVQLFSAKDGATWTIVLIQPNGTSCVVANGKYWQTLPTKSLDPGA